MIHGIVRRAFGKVEAKRERYPVGRATVSVEVPIMNIDRLQEICEGIEKELREMQSQIRLSHGTMFENRTVFYFTQD